MEHAHWPGGGHVTVLSRKLANSLPESGWGIAWFHSWRPGSSFCVLCFLGCTCWQPLPIPSRSLFTKEFLIHLLPPKPHFTHSHHKGARPPVWRHGGGRPPAPSLALCVLLHGFIQSTNLHWAPATRWNRFAGPLALSTGRHPGASQRDPVFVWGSDWRWASSPTLPPTVWSWGSVPPLGPLLSYLQNEALGRMRSWNPLNSDILWLGLKTCFSSCESACELYGQWPQYSRKGLGWDEPKITQLCTLIPLPPSWWWHQGRGGSGLTVPVRTLALGSHEVAYCCSRKISSGAFVIPKPSHRRSTLGLWKEVEGAHRMGGEGEVEVPCSLSIIHLPFLPHPHFLPVFLTDEIGHGFLKQKLLVCWSRNLCEAGSVQRTFSSEGV